MIGRMIETTLQTCEDEYMNGTADRVSGDVQAPTHHFYRVGDVIVRTDNYGFKWTERFASVAKAEAVFDELDREYGIWLSAAE